MFPVQDCELSSEKTSIAVEIIFRIIRIGQIAAIATAIILAAIAQNF
jgi:hypothetical protein